MEWSEWNRCENDRRVCWALTPWAVCNLFWTVVWWDRYSDGKRLWEHHHCELCPLQKTGFHWSAYYRWFSNTHHMWGFQLITVNREECTANCNKGGAKNDVQTNTRVNLQDLIHSPVLINAITAMQQHGKMCTWDGKPWMRRWWHSNQRTPLSCQRRSYLLNPIICRMIRY